MNREEDLIEAARKGKELDCEKDPLRADLIRELLLGKHGDLDPRGVRFVNARITGLLDLNHVEAKVGLRLASCVFDEPITAYAAHLPWLHLPDSEFPALAASRIRIDDTLNLDSVRATGSVKMGTIQLANASVGGELDLENAHVTNDTGPALHADGLQADSTVRLVNARLVGSSINSAVRLLGARLRAQLLVTGTEITSDEGPAFMADRLRADSSVRFSETRMSGIGIDGVLRLPGARVEGQLDLSGLQIAAGDGPMLNLENASAGMVLVDSGLFGTSQQVLLDGFTFNSLSALNWLEWLHTIRRHTRAYAPQPYQQLAAVERASGHDGNARRILIAQQEDLYRRLPTAIGGWWTRRFHQLFGLLAGYGYRARRTALALLIALLLAGALGFTAGHVTGAAERPDGEQCSSVELIGVGLDRGLPLSSTGIRTRCDLNTATTWGQVFTVAIWFVQAAVWGLATLAIAGYTGLVRKTA